MPNRSATTAQTPKELLDNLHALVADVEKMMGAALFDQTEEALDALRERFAAAQERLNELYQGAKTRVVAEAQSTDDSIRANPYQAIALAARIGLLVGVLLGRRKA
jgi:ElaB/YqjD/DUF883 family membrane-anchored ribosome-binding protein